MTPLQQTALDFCREVLGWDNCFVQDFASEAVIQYTSNEPNRHLRFTDLNAVLAAVCDWCDKHEINIDMYYVPAPTGLWHIDVNCDPIASRDPCHALMTVRV